MRFILPISFWAVLQGLNVYGQEQIPLTKNEKKEDFTYLYKTLKETYPYFGVNKRAHGIDWLANKSKYTKRICATQNDTTFYKEINQIMLDLNSGHSDTYPTLIYDYFIEGYKLAAQEDSSYVAMVEELEKSSSKKCAYWTSIDESIHRKNNAGGSNETHNPENNKPNISIQFIDYKSIALISIHSFSYDLIEQDKDTLKTFLKKAFDYDKLIINIQGNGGGNSEYWQNHIVPYLINQDISYHDVLAFRNHERIFKFKPHYSSNMDYSELKSLPKLPPELNKKSFLYQKNKNTVLAKPENGPYKGKIYLLVDGHVFSSAESFAFFCKSTKFATVAGTTTNGAGVGSDPILLALPNSGIIIRYTTEMGLNPDGSSNEEMKTQPDIELKGKSKQDRLNELLQSIQ